MPVTPRRPRPPRRLPRKYDEVPLTPLERFCRDDSGWPDLDQVTLVQRHLGLLRMYRASEAFVAFVWPAEVRKVHSVIDQTYGRELEERVAYADRVRRLEERLTTLEVLMRAEEGA